MFLNIVFEQVHHVLNYLLCLKKEAEVIDWNDGFEMVAPNVSKWSGIKKAYLPNFELVQMKS
ncbi:hypothetical protein GCM10020331_094270 [Ectobacillus funiculus]